MTSIKRVFKVDGRPFFTVGGQAQNSSGYNDAESETAFKAVKLLHGNTLEIPVYWNQVEPEEGKFDWTSVDALLNSARRHGVKLVLLWFATWKNGNMDYSPAWVKSDPQRFKRVVSATGKSVWVLSSHCQANQDADRKAFTAFCEHLKARDSAEHTVIAIQIENEPGILGSDRDYGPEAQAQFDAPVPAELVTRMKAAGAGRVYDLWQQAGAKRSGSWSKMFGWAGGELMTAWSIATYIDRLAEAGKAIMDVSMYINVWLGEQGWAIAGESYPSGGSVGKVLDIFKWCTPHVDLIAPDIYIADSRGYEAICAIYARDDNPLFVPESSPFGSNVWNMYRAIAEYSAIGYHFFAIENIVGEDGKARPEMQPIVDSMRTVAAVAPLLLKYQGTGKIHAVIQEENLASQRLDLDGCLAVVEFGEGFPRFISRDWRHRPDWVSLRPSADTKRGCGLVIQASEKELYLVGAHYRLNLRPKLSPDLLDPSAWGPWSSRQVGYIRVDEGHLDEQGRFIADRERNGDEISSGLWVEPDIGVLRVILSD
jgi:hypothetical protein